MSEYKSTSRPKHLSYKDSGVDIDLATETLRSVREDISSTFSTDVISDLSGFAGLYSLDIKKYRQPVIVSATDGVGTKLLLAKQAGLYSNIGQDLVGMCANDVSCCGAKPIIFLDYIATGKIEPEVISEIIKGIAASCREIGASLVGGETAEMPGVYSKGDVDIAGFCTGIVEKSKIIRVEKVNQQDMIIGISSSGIHSNGFSLVRDIIDKNGLDLKSRCIEGDPRTLQEIILEPTRLYSNLITEILENGIEINGIAHITGGGFFDNITRILPKHLDAEIDVSSYDIPRVFEFLAEKGSIDSVEMYRVFNMGIGMVLILPGSSTKSLKSLIKDYKCDFYQIGKVKDGTGKVILKGF